MARRILITGASDGLGRALALGLAAPGIDLVLTGRNPQSLNDVAETARSKGATAEIHLLELSSAREVEEFGQWVVLNEAGLDALIHNAAVIKLGSIAESSIADLDWHYQVNLRSPVLLTQLLLLRLRQARGQLVFINSAAGLSARKRVGFYAATKHALKAVADSLREELAPDGITVLSVYPSRLNTRMQARVLEMEGSSSDMSSFLQPEETARVIIEAMQRCGRHEISDLTLRLGRPPSYA